MAKYTIEIEIDEFEDKALKRRAKMKEIKAEDVLKEIVNDVVVNQLDELVADALNTKLTKMPAGKALAILESMED